MSILNRSSEARDCVDDELKIIELNEINRRKFCIEQAAYLDDLSPERLIATAEKIYAYIWGAK